MFCPNCGANNKELAKFCVKCGTPLDAAPAAPVYEQQTPRYQQSPGYTPPAPVAPSAPAGYGHRAPINMDKAKLIKIAAAAAALIVLILAIVFISKGCSGGSGCSRAEDVPKQAIDAFIDANGKKMLNLLPPPVVNSATGGYEFTRSDLERSLSNEMSYASEDIWDEYGGRPKYTVTIVDKYNYDSYDIEEWEEEYEYYYDTKMNIQAVTEMEVELNINHGEDYEYLNMTALKVDGRWYLDMDSLETLMDY